MSNDKNIDRLIRDVSEEQPFKETTELGEVFNNLDSEENLEKNSRLKEHEISSIISIESLNDMGIWDFGDFTRQFKKHKISQDGLGRAEKVTTASASRSAELSGRSGGIIGGIKSFFSPRGNE